MTNEEIMKVVKPVICNQLKSPSSAQFPVDLISIVGDDTRGYQVSGFVDSQNSYGAMLRNDFTATVVVENGFPVVKSSSVAVKATINSAVNWILYLVLAGIGSGILYLISYFFVEQSLHF